MNQLAPSPSQQSEQLPCGLVSLGDIMQRYQPSDFLALERLHRLVCQALDLKSSEDKMPPNALMGMINKQFRNDELDKSLLESVLGLMMRSCADLSLEHSARSIEPLKHFPPQTARELAIYYDMMMREIGTHAFFHVNPDRAKWWSAPGIVGQLVREEFSEAASELKNAGSCYACDQPTACVFHSMRAAEQGLRRIAADLDINADDEQWKNAIDQIEKAARALETKPKYETKKLDQQFYSEAALQLGLMKDAWRNHVAHSKVSYQPPEALEIMKATCRFFEKLAERLANGQKDSGQGV